MTFYIHIGMQKTGSSAIQAFLARNHAVLRAKGYTYPDAPAFDQAYETSAGNALRLSSWFDRGDRSTVHHYLKELCEHPNVVLSSEALFTTVADVGDLFFEAFAPYDVRLICYVRRQDALLASSYNQLVKNHGYCDPPSPRLAAHLPDAHSVLMSCRRYLDDQNIIVRPYEQQQFIGGTIYSDFLSCLELNWQDDEYVLPGAIVNPSFDRNTLEVRRRLNQLEVDSHALSAKFAINAALAKHVVRSGNGSPFQESQLFSSSERRAIIELHSAKNRELAEVFLKRKELFLDPLPEFSGDEADRSWRLTSDQTWAVCRTITNGVDDEMVDLLVRGLAAKLTDRRARGSLLLGTRETNIVYRLSAIPELISPHVTAFEHKHGAYVLEAIGDDPFFILPGPIENDGTVFVSIELTSQSATTLDVYFSSAAHHFDEGHRASELINRGYNEVVLQLADDAPIESIRVDPGKTPGIYLLHSLEVRV